MPLREGSAKSRSRPSNWNTRLRDIPDQPRQEGTREMAENGLCISIEEFRKLPTREQLRCLYENQVRTIKLIGGYKFYYRMTMTIGAFLASGVGAMFLLMLNHFKGG